MLRDYYNYIKAILANPDVIDRLYFEHLLMKQMCYIKVKM